MSDPQNPQEPSNPANQPGPSWQPPGDQPANAGWPTQQAEPAANAGWPTQQTNGGWPGQPQPPSATAGWPGQPQPGYGQPQAAPGWQQPDPNWQPQPAVWPPPASNQAYQTIFFPFRFLYMRVDGWVSDFREGTIGLDPGGVTIAGKMQPRAEIFQTIQLITFLISALICIIASVIMRYAALRPEQIRLSWQQVRQIVLQPNKRRACIVFDAPNYRNVIKTFSLAFTLPPAEYEAFSNMATQFGASQTTVGKLKSATSPVVWAILIIFVIVMTLAIIASMRHS